MHCLYTAFNWHANCSCFSVTCLQQDYISRSKRGLLLCEKLALYNDRPSSSSCCPKPLAVTAYAVQTRPNMPARIQPRMGSFTPKARPTPSPLRRSSTYTRAWICGPQTSQQVQPPTRRAQNGKQDNEEEADASSYEHIGVQGYLRYLCEHTDMRTLNGNQRQQLAQAYAILRRSCVQSGFTQSLRARRARNGGVQGRMLEKPRQQGRWSTPLRQPSWMLQEHKIVTTVAVRV